MDIHRMTRALPVKSLLLILILLINTAIISSFMPSFSSLPIVSSSRYQAFSDRSSIKHVVELHVKREGRRGHHGGSTGGGRAGTGRRKVIRGGEASKDPEKRLAMLNRKLSSILELEDVPFDELNEDQRKKVERKESILEEISRLTKLLKKQEFIEDAAEHRAEATSAEDLTSDLVGGRMPKTLLKLLVYCRVSDKATCEILLELGKVKVNGEVCDNPVALVDLVKDRIEFDGDLVTLPETRLKHKLRSTSNAEGVEEVPKDYCARIDGGLLIDLTRNIQKKRGDFIDKSPYIMRSNNQRR